MKDGKENQQLGGDSLDAEGFEVEVEKIGDTIKCLTCGEVITKIWRHTYDTEVLKDGRFVDDGSGYSEIFCAHCETELSSEELEALGLI